MGARARWAVAVAVALTVAVVSDLTGCGSGGKAATAPRPSSSGAPAPADTGEDSCYLVRLDLQTLAQLPPGGSRETVLAQLTADASTGSAALKGAVAAYVRGTGSQQAVQLAC